MCDSPMRYQLVKPTVGCWRCLWISRPGFTPGKSAARNINGRPTSQWNAPCLENNTPTFLCLSIGKTPTRHPDARTPYLFWVAGSMALRGSADTRCAGTTPVLSNSGACRKSAPFKCSDL
jgi:hypothetical protein